MRKIKHIFETFQRQNGYLQLRGTPLAISNFAREKYVTRFNNTLESNDIV